MAKSVKSFIREIENTNFRQLCTMPLEKADPRRDEHFWHYKRARETFGKVFENPQEPIDSIKNRINELKQIIDPKWEEVEKIRKEYNSIKYKKEEGQYKYDKIKNNRLIEKLEEELKVPLKKLETYESQLYRSKEMKLSDSVLKSIEDNISRIKNTWGDKIAQLRDYRYFRPNWWQMEIDLKNQLVELHQKIDDAENDYYGMPEVKELKQLREELEKKEKAREKALKNADISNPESNIIHHCRYVYYWIKYNNHVQENNAKLIPLYERYQNARKTAERNAERALFLESFAESDEEIAEFCKLVDNLPTDIWWLKESIKDFETLYDQIVSMANVYPV